MQEKGEERKARERRQKEAVHPRKFYEHLTLLLIQPRAEKKSRFLEKKFFGFLVFRIF